MSECNAITELFNRLRLSRQWVAAQFGWVLVWIWINLALLHLPGAERWPDWLSGTLQVSCSVSVMVAALVVQAGMLRNLLSRHAKRVRLVWGILALLLSGLLYAIAFSMQDDYLPGQIWQWLLDFILTPAVLFPFAAASAVCGWRLPWRKVLRVVCAWRWWLGVLLAGAFGILAEHYFDGMRGWPKVWDVDLATGLKMGAIDILEIAVWVLLLGWLAVLFDRSECDIKSTEGDFAQLPLPASGKGAGGNAWSFHRMGTLSDVTPHRPEYRLYDSGAVGLAAFICCPLAGAILIAVNYVRLGKTGKSVVAVTAGLIATAANILIKLNWNTPPGSLARLEFDAFEILYLIGMWFCTWQVAKEEQGEAIAEHIAHGGQLDSRFTAGCVGFATAAALAVLAGAVIYAYQYRKVVIIGTKDQVIYSGLATKADAAALGGWLKSDEYFQDRGASVLLDKGFGSTTISFGVQEGVGSEPGTLSGFEELTRELAPLVGGFPVQIRLVDSQGNLEKTSTVGEVRFDGGDGLYYEGSANKAEAQALGQKLKSMGFFRGKGANVVLIRHDDGVIIEFPMIGEAWNDSKEVGALEAIVREVAPTVGGLPIEMRLVDLQMELKKTEEIN